MLYPILVPVEYVAWELVNDGHTHCAVVLARIQHLYKFKDKLDLKGDDDRLYITVEKLQYFLEYALKERTIKDALKTLKKEYLIDYTNEYIELNTVLIDALKQSIRSILNTNLSYLPVFYCALRYRTEKHPRSYVEYGLSKLMQDFFDNKLKKTMSIKYRLNKYGSLFSRKQLYTIFNYLKSDGLIIQENAHHREENWDTICSFDFKMDVIKTDIIEEHNNEFATKKEARKQLYEDEYEFEDESIFDNLTVIKLDSAMRKRKQKNNNYSTTTQSFDGVTVCEYTAEEKEQMQKEWEELQQKIADGTAVEGVDYF